MTRDELKAFIHHQLVLWYDGDDPTTRKLADHLATRLHLELAKTEKSP